MHTVHIVETISLVCTSQISYKLLNDLETIYSVKQNAFNNLQFACLLYDGKTLKNCSRLSSPIKKKILRKNVLQNYKETTNISTERVSLAPFALNSFFFKVMMRTWIVFNVWFTNFVQSILATKNKDRSRS